MTTEVEDYEVEDYTVEETPEAIVAEGVLMRSKVYNYPEQGLRLLKPKEEIAKIPKLVKWVPLTLKHPSGADVPHEERDVIIGGFTPTRAEDGKLVGRFEFLKERTPESVIRLVRSRKPIPVSGGFTTTIVKEKGPNYDGKQTEIFLKHASIVLEGTPRCGVEEGCAVGLVDGSDGSTKQFRGELKGEKNESENRVDHMTEVKTTVDAEALKRELEAYKAAVEEALDSMRADIIDAVNDILSEDEVKKLDLDKISDAKALGVIKRIVHAVTPKLLKPKPKDAAALPAGEPEKEAKDKFQELRDAYIQRQNKRWKYSKEA